MKRKIDINCDLGELKPPDGNDLELMPLISSCNIACGYHAGDTVMMRETVALAREHGVAIGAHPGYDDKEEFGRRFMELTDRELSDLVLIQVEALQEIAARIGCDLQHVKPHGALYNYLARNYAQALIVADTVQRIDRDLILYVLSGSCSETAANEVGITIAKEGFIDRQYLADGSLMARSHSEALITDVRVMGERAVKLALGENIRDESGASISIPCDTLCIHGDQPAAVETAVAVRESLRRSRIEVKSLR